MSKIKMRCINCGKWFQSANAKEVTCPDCTQKARREKMVAKTTPPQQGRPADQTPGAGARPVPPPPRPKPAASGTNQWLDSLNDVKVGEPDQPPPRPKLPTSSAPRDNRGDQERGGNYDRDRDRYNDRDRGPGSTGPGNYRDRDERGPSNYREGNRGPGGFREGNRSPGGFREGGNRGPGPGGYRDNDYRTPYRVGGGMGIPDTIGPRPRQPMEGGPNRDRGARPEKFHPGPGGKPGAPRGKGPKPPRPPAPPRPKKEKIPPPKPFEPTPEQVTQVENRYIELATPAEFDGIRTQISKELSIPKTAVKKIIKELRDRQSIPSWWELQTYKGSDEELAKIRAVYEPMLPVPPVGVHKQIADQLEFKPSVVYQAIKVIRQEMKLPQYNDPTLHGLEATPPKDGTQPDATGETTAVTVEAPTDSTVSADGTQPTQAESVNGAQAATVTSNVDDNSTAKAEVEAENNHELQAESKGEITSIETDTEFHREGDTIEVGATPAAEQSDTNAE